MSERFCMYCRCDKPAGGFVDIVDPKYRTRRGQCSDCQQTRKLPRDTLQQMALRESAARREQARTAAIVAADRKRKHEQDTGHQ